MSADLIGMGAGSGQFFREFLLLGGDVFAALQSFICLYSRITLGCDLFNLAGEAFQTIFERAFLSALAGNIRFILCEGGLGGAVCACLLYTSPSPRDRG